MFKRPLISPARDKTILPGIELFWIELDNIIERHY